MLRVNLIILFVLSTVAFRDDDVAERPDVDGLEGHDVHSHTPTERGGTYLSSFLGKLRQLDLMQVQLNVEEFHF